MKSLYTTTVVLISFFLLVSFSNNPPNGKTGAPGDGLCTECHQQNNPSQNGSVEVTGFPDQITPGQVYPLSVVVSNPDGTASIAGFQMTIQDGAGVGAGTMLNPDDNSTVSSAGTKQYFEHDPALSLSGSATWTVEWQAPEGPLDAPIFYYAAGNVGNGNGQNSGDLITTTSGEALITVSSSTDDVENFQIEVYPNPASDILWIKIGDESSNIQELQIFSIDGKRINNDLTLDRDYIDVSNLNGGTYLLRLQIDGKWHVRKWSKM